MIQIWDPICHRPAETRAEGAEIEAEASIWRFSPSCPNHYLGERPWIIIDYYALQ